CASGELDQAFENLAACRDRLSEMKRIQLRLDELISFVSGLRHRLRGETPPAAPSSDEAWENAGFDDTFQKRRWQETGLDPAVAAEWRSQGSSPHEAKQWVHLGLQPEQTAQWKSAGWDNPAAARLWIKAGFSPDQAAPWVDAFANNPQAAIQCLAVGFVDPQRAAEWMRVFQLPVDALQWEAAGFSPAEALLLRESGITDPFVAKEQRTAEMAGDTTEDDA
ncbi:MAG: hypothetical protein KDD44_05990, partial [Bdellovibrionales bacterium]|nr:hypothetical protein [Bdellovibrionales bacterium]